MWFCFVISDKMRIEKKGWVKAKNKCVSVISGTNAFIYHFF